MTAVQRGGWTASGSEPTRLVLLRHGQTAASVRRLYSGRGNPELTELGHRQAEGAAALLAGTAFDAAYCSPLRRAQQTARAVAAGRELTIRTAEPLIETDFGAWEGMGFAAARERDPQLHARWLGDPAVPAPGGESFDQVRARVSGLVDEIVTAHPAQTVLLVSHVTPIKTVLRYALGVGPELLYRLHLDLASISIAEFYPDGGASVRLVNRAPDVQ